MKVVIIDDEERSRRTLAKILELNFPHFEILGEGHDVRSGLGQIAQHQPQLVFLDIEMPDGTGFDLLQQIPNPSFEVIFTTAYDQYALQAFRFSAVAYILKPIDDDDLKKAVEKAEKLLKYSPVIRSDHMRVLLDNYNNGNDNNCRLVLPHNKGFHILFIKDIIRCKGERNYTRLFLSDGKSILSSKTLGHFETILEPRRFLRVSKSHLVNLSHVSQFLNTEGGTVVMTDEEAILISPTKREQFKKLFF